VQKQNQQELRGHKQIKNLTYKNIMNVAIDQIEASEKEFEERLDGLKQTNVRQQWVLREMGELKATLQSIIDLYSKRESKNN